MINSFKTVVTDPRQALSMEDYYKMISRLVKIDKLGRQLYTCDIDLAFQSLSRWTFEQQKEFINSCMIGMNISKFVLVDVKSCRDTHAKGSTSYDYFDGWLSLGVKYLNVDSNNRTITIRKFVTNKIPLKPGEYTIGNSVLAKKDDDDENFISEAPVVSVFTIEKSHWDKKSEKWVGGNDRYSIMPKELKKIFDDSIISIHMIASATRTQLSDVFTRMNSGESLNFFEKVNSSNSLACTLIRDVSFKSKDILKDSGLFKENDILRRNLDGWFANLLYIWVKWPEFRNQLWLREFGRIPKYNKKVHKDFYEDSSETSSFNIAVSKFSSDWMEFVEKRIKTSATCKCFSYKWALSDLFFQISNQEKARKKLRPVSEVGDVVEDFLLMFTSLVGNTSAQWYYDPLNEKGTPETDRVPFPFKQFYRGGDPENQKARNYGYVESGWDISKYFDESRDTNRNFSSIEKQYSAVESGLLDSDGDGFLLSEVHAGSFDAGHIKAYDKGGKTEGENCIIQKSGKNRGNGSNETVIADAVVEIRDASRRKNSDQRLTS